MGAHGSTSRAAHVATRIAVGLVALLAVAWVVALEFVVAAAWLHPTGWVLALAPAALFLVVTCTPGAVQPRVRWLAAGSLLLAALVVVVPWNARKRFVHDVFSVHAGMPVDAVEAVMAGYIKGAGPQWEPLPESAAHERADTAPTYREPEYPTGRARQHFTGTMTYRWSTAASYNADWGLVHFVNGTVAKVEFLPD